MNDSEIKTGPGGGITFAGPDAVALYRATAIEHGLRLYAKTGMKPNRAWTPSAMLQAATGITGKPYKRGQYVKAADDVKAWAVAMAAALPVVKE
jgi:hypothetical protein